MTIIIVGAGIVGAACADALSGDGHAVTVVDGAFAGGGTTAAGMGHLTVMDDSPAQFALTRLSVQLWTELRNELGPECEFDPCGTLWVAADDEEMAGAESKAAAYTAAGVEAQLVGPTELVQLEPALRTGLTGGMRVTGDAVVYPTNAARWLLQRARDGGAEVLEGRSVQQIDGPTVVFTDGKLRAELVINAAGSHASNLTPGMPVKARRGHLVITDRYPNMVHHQVLELGYLKSAHSTTGPSVAFNVQPRKTGQLLIGSSREYVGWDETINRTLVGSMLERAAAFMPSLAEVSVDRVWIGFRPATPDKLPLIGEVSEGVWMAAGHEGLGIVTSLGTARLIADQLAGRTPPIDPVPYRANRFAGVAVHE
jgi:glycine/D-amino acid oxidase-like deaminating enzyme